ncbi:nucleolar protein 14-like [Macrobrachium nipponense]|uniref:nucleolar protein 14-like n=1 Tax=Macrobrachium nipponense TaxID=159736 RepID=UPI0030C7ABBE
MAKKSKFKPKTGGKAQNQSAEKINPFEIHVNRSKHDVLGRKRKEDRGLPGIARAKALKKREKTLLQEYKTRHKSNLFVDRRIGENDPTLDPEKKIALRLAAVKTKHANRKSMFNLNDEDFLTHGGKTLDDDNIDDRMAFSDDEDDQMLDGKL